MLLSEAIESYCNYVLLHRKIQPINFSKVRKKLTKFQHWLGNINIEAITAENILKYRAYLRGVKSESIANYGELMQETTIQKHVQEIKAFFKYTNSKQYTSVTLEDIIVGKFIHRRRVILNGDDLEKLLETPRMDTASGLRNRAIVELMISTGLRVNEVAGLKRKNIDLVSNEIGIIGKGNKPAIIFFSDRCKNWLTKYLQARDDINPSLFINHLTEESITTKGIEKMIPLLGREAGILYPISAHILRHTAITMFQERTKDIYLTKLFARHEDIRTTEVYIHLRPTAVKEKIKEVMNF